ncbi:hypothetical protein DL770_001748 [Monosporascus sp. CRB-9-2]|nr:hypothetical protein DL770_001748 [Monosporascus sp. CRB-9-2]
MLPSTPEQTRDIAGDVFLAARNDFLNSLSADTKSDFVQCRTSKELLQEASKFDSFRSNRKLYAAPLDGLKRFNDHLESYFEIVGIAIQSNPEIACLVWSALRLVFKLASNFGAFFDKLSELLDEYGNKLPRFEEILKLAPAEFSERFRDTLKHMYLDLFELFKAIAQLFSNQDGCTSIPFPFDLFEGPYLIPGTIQLSVQAQSSLGNSYGGLSTNAFETIWSGCNTTMMSLRVRDDFYNWQ